MDMMKHPKTSKQNFLPLTQDGQSNPPTEMDLLKRSQIDGFVTCV